LNSHNVLLNSEKDLLNFLNPHLKFIIKRMQVHFYIKIMFLLLFRQGLLTTRDS
jgi:hypothetical protein